MSEQKKPGYAESDARAKAEAANRESSYYVDPNRSQSQAHEPNEPVDEGKSGDKMVGKTTGGQDRFKSEGM